jgi:hypothetical protein
MLWDENPISNIGSGSSVTVTGAYGDKALATRLFEIRETFGGDDLPARGTALQDAFDEILTLVGIAGTAVVPSVDDASFTYLLVAFALKTPKSTHF